MFTDILGNTRQKVALHIHTTRSDGKRSPDDVEEIYRNAGFDAIAFTDHWKWAENRPSQNGVTLLSGAEYNIVFPDPNGAVGGDGVYHITAIGCKTEPDVRREMTPDEICAAIRAAGGLAVLAHPAWSLNDPALIAAYNCFDATEIYNTVSGVHYSCRPDSSAFVDLLACRGICLPLIAADDAHYYGVHDAFDAAVAFVCVRASDNSAESVMGALRRGDYYASQGPEVIARREGDRIIVDCTPACEVDFYSNRVWAAGRVVRGRDLTHAEYTVSGDEFFHRVEVVDADGRRAWTGFVR